MHPRKKLWFAKFNIMGGITVERGFSGEHYLKEVIKVAFRDGLTHHTDKETFIVYPPGRIISVEVDRREASDDVLQYHLGPRWNI
ncbi:hypothetical protein D3C81_1229300 [compost metagenome]